MTKMTQNSNLQVVHDEEKPHFDFTAYGGSPAPRFQDVLVSFEKAEKTL